MAFTPSY
jgi:hypothetical protein